jgi:excisionase family DNA binding protein
MADTNTPTALCTVPEVQRILRCSKTTAYELMRSGELKRLKIGKKTLVPVESVEALLQRAGGGK